MAPEPNPNYRGHQKSDQMLFQHRMRQQGPYCLCCVRIVYCADTLYKKKILNSAFGICVLELQVQVHSSGGLMTSDGGVYAGTAHWGDVPHVMVADAAFPLKPYPNETIPQT